MNQRFKLRNGKNSSRIYFDFSSGTELRIRTSTPFKISLKSAKYWDKDKGRLKIPNNINNSDIINNALGEYEQQIMKKLLRLYNSNELNEISANKVVEEIINPNKKLKKLNETEKMNFSDFIQYYQYYIDIHKEQVSKHTRKMLSKGTLITYKTSLSLIKRFINPKKNLSFDKIDEVFMTKLLEYCYKNNYSTNYIGTVISKMRTILRTANEEGHHTNTIFNNSIFNRMTEPVNHISLSIGEINKIRDLKLDSKQLKNVRDIFIIACHTAMRVGDLVQFLKSENKIIIPKESRRLLYYIQSKTKKEIYIPIHDDILTSHK